VTAAPHQNNGLNTAIKIANVNRIRIGNFIVCDGDSSIPSAIELKYRAADAWIFSTPSLAHQQKSRSVFFTLTHTLDDYDVETAIVQDAYLIAACWLTRTFQGFLLQLLHSP